MTSEIQPLMDRPSPPMIDLPHSHHRHRTRSRKSTPVIIVALTTLMILASILLLYSGANHPQGPDPLIGNIYSTQANANLDRLLNDQPPQNTSVGCQGTLILLPHCEVSPKRTPAAKTNDECNFQGQERSYYLITQFGNDPIKRWPVPTFIAALGPKAKRRRAIQTVLPIQQYHNINLLQYKTRKSLVPYIAELFKTGQMCGKVMVVVVAVNTDISKLAFDLGCGPSNGCPMSFSTRDYDHGWELRFNYTLADDSRGDGDNEDHRTGSDSENSIPYDQLRWREFGAVVEEKFDPLAFSKKVGEYNGFEQDHIPKWMNMSIYANLDV